MQPSRNGGDYRNTCDKGQGSLTYKDHLGIRKKRKVGSGSFAARKNQVANNKKKMFQ